LKANIFFVVKTWQLWNFKKINPHFKSSQRKRKTRNAVHLKHSACSHKWFHKYAIQEVARRANSKI